MTRCGSRREGVERARGHAGPALLALRVALLLALLAGLLGLTRPDATAAEARPRQADFSTVGVYGIGLPPRGAAGEEAFGFCDINLPKIAYFGTDREPRNLSGRIREGKINLPIIYPFDRLSHSRPLAEYVANADVIMRSLEPDLGSIQAVILGEENVLANRGLEILNGLYEHITAHWPVAVYQWLQEPAPPAELKADGWVLDPYGCSREGFRRLLTKHLVTGKPVIDCIVASPYRDAPLEPKSRWQVEICREFNVPMCFYCVYDPNMEGQGSAYAWWSTDAPRIVACRQWLLGVVKEAHGTAAGALPLPTAERSDGHPIRVAGDETGRYHYAEDFSGTTFVNYADIDGFRSLRWDALRKAFILEPRRDPKESVTLTYHFYSDSEMAQPRARLLAQTGGAAAITLALSRDGRTWSSPATAQNRAEAPAEGALEAGDDEFRGKEFWVRIAGTVPGDASAVIDNLAITCQVTPPPERQVVLQPDQEGRVTYADDFQSQDYLHLGQIDNAESLFWTYLEHEGGYVLGIRGTGQRVVISRKFVAAVPLENIKVRMRSFANQRNLASCNTLAVSLEGQNRLWEDSTADKEADANGGFRGWLTLDLSADPRAQAVREFWVHMEMRGGGRASSESSATNLLYALQVQASPRR
jgi:hypothetical protein